MSSMLTTLLLADAVEKGGPGSGPHPGSGKKPSLRTDSGKKLHQIVTRSGYKFQHSTIVGTHQYVHPSGARASLHENSKGGATLTHNPAGGGFMDMQEFNGPNDSLLSGGLDPNHRR